MRNPFQTLLKPISLIAVATLMLTGCQSTGQNGKPLTREEIIQKREATLKMAQTGLDALLKQNPAAKKEIDEIGRAHV